ncbi:DUF885 family protein [Cystobacter fuscus]
MRAQPEEATTLGLHHLDDQLKDLSPAALGDEYALHRDVLARLERLPGEDFPTEARLDWRAMLDITRFHVHAYEELRGHRRNLELSTYPHTMLQYQIAQAETPGEWAAIASRAARIPTFLQQQERLLAEGLATGEVPDVYTVRDFAEDQLPVIVRYFEHLPEVPGAHDVLLPENERRALQHAAREAREAFAAHHRFLRERVLPHASPSVVLGADEYEWRLRHTFGLTASPEELVRRPRTSSPRPSTRSIGCPARSPGRCPVPPRPSPGSARRASCSPSSSPPSRPGRGRHPPVPGAHRAHRAVRPRAGDVQRARGLRLGIKPLPRAWWTCEAPTGPRPCWIHARWAGSCSPPWRPRTPPSGRRCSRCTRASPATSCRASPGSAPSPGTPLRCASCW